MYEAGAVFIFYSLKIIAFNCVWQTLESFEEEFWKENVSGLFVAVICIGIIYIFIAGPYIKRSQLDWIII